MPEVPAVPGVEKDLGEQVAQAFATDGPLATTLPGFEPRASQTEMAAAVARVFDRGGILLAEAGTGTGKTLAYLVPAILSRKRVLISTGTKNLQEQIFFKDIPALTQAIGVPFTATLMKGRANYLCLERFEQVRGGGTAATPVGAMFLPIVEAWVKRTETGDRAELEDLPEDVPLWNDISATAETCVGAECSRYDECFVTRMRQRAAESDVVIVNHHLLCADAAVRQNAYGEVIPSCPRIVVDEAHQLEDIATQYFGYSVSTYRIEDFARDAERASAAAFAGDRKTRDEVARGVEKLRDHAQEFFTELTFAHRTSSYAGGEERTRATPESLADAADSAAALTGALDVVQATLALAMKPAADGGVDGEPLEAVAALVRRAGELRDELRFLLRASDPEYVYYVEFRGRAFRRGQGAASLSRGGVFLRASPIDVSAIVRELVFDKMQATVLTSATLTVDGRFDYIRSRLGVRSAEEVRLPSEFDYGTQAMLYLPPRMPDPRSIEFAGAAGREVVEILRRTHGRAFVLFTSYAMLRAVQGIAEMALDYPILVQGTAPRTQLIRQFRETPHSVLFATSSFWQGVDVIGEALSCVVVDKLPFASPGDPITAARIDSIRAQGGEPFSEYQVPLAILTLQQGLGRLIRHRRDRGILAVLDPRLRTKGYGRRFLASLPQAPVVHDLDRIGEFFDRV